MIISALGNLIYSLLNLLLVFDLPQMPESISAVLTQASVYLNDGMGLLVAFIGQTAAGILSVLLNLLLLMHGAYMLYTFVKFVLRKIPMLGIDL